MKKITDNKPLVSIIIPVYNVELYLKDCLNSVLNQSFKDFEIILINDGSTDESPIICEYYYHNNKNITLVNQENKGLSATRNKGIEIAKGKYIAFIDSDDLIHIDFLKVLITHIGTSDISICTIEEFQDGNSIVLNIEQNPSIITLSGTEMNDFLYHPVHAVTTIIAPNKLYKKSLWDGLQFPINRLHEDCAVIYKIIDKATQVTLIDYNLYFYRKRINSITSIRSFKSLKDEYDAATEQIYFFQQKKQFSIIKNANRFRKLLFLHPSLDKNWDAWKQYNILNILQDDLRTKVKLKLILKKIRLFFNK